MCGHGGIGRRVRLRGVWDDRVSSSLTGRTKKKNQVNRLGFFMRPSEACVRQIAQCLWHSTHTTCIVTLRFLSKLNRYAITDTLCPTSTHYPHQRQAKACLFFAPVDFVCWKHTHLRCELTLCEWRCAFWVNSIATLFRHSVPHKYTLPAPRKRTKSTDLVFFMRQWTLCVEKMRFLCYNKLNDK